MDQNRCNWAEKVKKATKQNNIKGTKPVSESVFMNQFAVPSAFDEANAVPRHNINIKD